MERIADSRPIELDPIEWGLSHGVQQTFCETLWTEDEDGERTAFSKQVLEFAHTDSFIFSAGSAQARLMTNWNQLRDDVTAMIVMPCSGTALPALSSRKTSLPLSVRRTRQRILSKPENW